MKKKKLIFILPVLLITLSMVFLIRHFFLSRSSQDYKRPGFNVILISLDTLRADHIGAYGYGKNTSPNIDKFAEKAILFENSFCNSTWTLPSHMSLMTSLYPSTHRVLDKKKKLSGSMKTIAEVLKENGYLTAAFTAGFYVSKVFGFNRGFDLYKEDYNAKRENAGQGWRLKHVIKDAFSWLEEHSKEKFFLFIQCYDNHEPFIAHTYLKEFEESCDNRLNFLNSHSDFIKHKDYTKYKAILNIKGYFNINIFYRDIINKNLIHLTEADKNHMIALYDNEIKFVDHYFSKLIAGLERLKLMEKTILILWSDHGEELLERGKIQHGGSFYEELLRVPLVIYIPGYPGSGRNKALAQSIDIAPTILDTLDIKPENNFRGIPLLSADSPGNPFVIGQSTGVNSIRTGKYKLLYAKRKRKVKLYDLEKDPGERKNVAEFHPGIVKKLKKDLFDILNIVELDKTMIEKLETLGYTDNN